MQMNKHESKRAALKQIAIKAVAVIVAFIAGFGFALPALANEGGGLPQLRFADYSTQIFWLIISFIVLYFWLKSAILPKLSEAISNRAAIINDDLTLAKKLKDDATTMLADYEKSLVAARSKADDMIDTKCLAITNANRTRMAELNKHMQAELQTAKLAILAEKKLIMNEVDEMAAEAAEVIIKQITGQNIERSLITAAIEKNRAFNL